MRKVVIIVSVLIGTFLIGLLVLNLILSDLNTEDIRNDKKIFYPLVDEELEFNSRLWGLSGNHEEIILSGKNTVNDKDKSYIFYTTELYYKKSNDSLIIYTNPSFVKAPSKFESPVRVVIKNLNTASELADYKANYHNYGLSKFSAFE